MSSGRITQLQAVNRILEGLGSPHVPALETGQATLAGDAEKKLDEMADEVQAEGWFTGVTEEYEYKIPTETIVISGGAGTFEFDETITETTSGATGQYKFSGAKIHMVPLTGTFTGSETLTGGSSGATRDGAAYAVVTESALYVNRDWVRVTRSQRESLRIAKRGDALYNETDQTALFSASILLDVHRDLYLSDLPFNLATYVAARAAVKFQRWKKRGRVDDAMLAEEARLARINALNEDEDMRQTNTLKTAEAREVKGDRQDFTW